MRSMWKGVLSFGLVSIPVKLYTATEQHDVSFKQVRQSDGSRIRYKRVAEADGEEVPYGEIAKGYELPDGQMMIIDEQDLADLPLPTKRVVDLLEFVPLADVDPIYFNKSYYLEPDGPGLKPYALLRDALKSSAKVAVVKVAIANREQLATLRVKDDVIVLATMLWPDEIRTPDFSFLHEEVSVRPQELAMADSLIESMSSDFDPSLFRDEFQTALAELIEAKVDGHALTPPTAAAADSGNVVNLLSALQASIEKAQAGRKPADTGAASQAVAPKAKETKERRTGARKAAGSESPSEQDATEDRPPAKPAARTGSRAKQPAPDQPSGQDSSDSAAVAKKSTARKAPRKSA
jgi:DNA end-binding protein Ku